MINLITGNLIYVIARRKKREKYRKQMLDGLRKDLTPEERKRAEKLIDEAVKLL
jgi:hypothetical protein